MDFIEPEFQNEVVVVFESEKVSTYIIPISIFKNGRFISWRLNRPVDKLRVNEISDYMCKEQPVKIDGEILAAKISSEWAEGRCFFEVYDGNHRREATLIEYINLNPNAKVIITIITVEDDQDLMTHFHRINKVVPLSDVHLQTDNRLTKMLYEIAEEYSAKFPSLCKGTNRVVRPNFNRDGFVESMYKIMMDSEGKIRAKSQMIYYLDLYNDYIRDNFKFLKGESVKSYTVKGLNITSPMYKKADEIGCYIFLGKNLVIDILEIVHAA
jgi:hypothetical protein